MQTRPSVMKHQFSQVPKADIPRSTFDRSHGNKTTFDAGMLIPILVDEVLPGDTFNVNMTGFARLATPIFPIMDNMYMDTQFFAVPVRLLWTNWAKFNGAQTNPGDSTDFIIPTITAPAGGHIAGSLSDYMGIPTLMAGIVHSALWHRAYNLIWNEWYRDENLQNSITVNTGNGPDAPTDYVVKRRGKRHDYFTSALPWPQKGTAVSLPLGTKAFVASDIAVAGGNFYSVRNMAVHPTDPWLMSTSVASLEVTSTSGSASNALYADLSSATAATINQLRQAFQIQKLLERDARGGTRYTEVIRSHFGVTSPDARLQRPEYLGGGSSPIGITPVTSNTPTTGTAPQGNLAAYGTALLHNHGFNKSFTEHCIIIGLVSVRADLNYQQGLNRMFSRSTRYDFYWPALAQIGEQTILRKEIYATGVTADDNIVFGYQERYAEYRYKPSTISGLFRTNATGSLDSWHLAQNFTAPPTLGGSFIEDVPPIARVIAVPSEPHFLFDSYFKMICARPMPVFGVPGMIDHF